MIDIRKLQRGDIIQHASSKDSYVVITGYEPGHAPVAVRHVVVTNAVEWALFSRSERVSDLAGTGTKV